MDASAIRFKVLQYAEECPAEWIPSGKEKGAMVGALDRSVDPAGQHKEERSVWRRILLSWLFYPLHRRPTAVSSKVLSVPQWYALYRWIGWWQDELEGGWQYDPDFLSEVPLCLAQAMREHDERILTYGELHE